MLTSTLNPEAEGLRPTRGNFGKYTLRVCGRKTTVAEYSVVKESACAARLCPTGFGEALRRDGLACARPPNLPGQLDLLRADLKLT